MGFSGLKYHCPHPQVDYVHGHLQPEPTNPHDPNAIAIIADGIGKIGYVPRNKTQHIAFLTNNNLNLDIDIRSWKGQHEEKAFFDVYIDRDNLPETQFSNKTIFLVGFRDLDLKYRLSDRLRYEKSYIVDRYSKSTDIVVYSGNREYKAVIDAQKSGKQVLSVQELKEILEYDNYFAPQQQPTPQPAPQPTRINTENWNFKIDTDQQSTHSTTDRSNDSSGCMIAIKTILIIIAAIIVFLIVR